MSVAILIITAAIILGIGLTDLCDKPQTPAPIGFKKLYHDDINKTFKTATGPIESAPTLFFHSPNDPELEETPMIKYRVEIRDNGDKFTYKFGTDTLHNEHGPCVEYTDGGRQWRFDGCLHRLDGPAFEHSSGLKSWFIVGKRLTEEEFNDRINGSSCEGKVVEVDGKKYKFA